jgi:sulfoxide reductase heme-binding subunit YedZ
MSAGYTHVQWNRHKRLYDLVVGVGVVGYLILFLLVSRLTWQGEHAISDEILLIRGTGTLAIILLHIILMIGPLARLDARFAPLLYNRRHLGVITFIIAFLHAFLVLGFYHGFGVVNPFVSLLTSNTNYDSFTAFPFETLGILALLILFLMAATSHDFWNRNLGPAWWKTLHMGVYVAYGLLVGHVALGALQSERAGANVALTAAGAAVVIVLHLVAGWRERDTDGSASGDWIAVPDAEGIAEGKARTIETPGGERVAVFRHEDKLHAVSNVCRHQAGPLGEGEIIDGCITCPWHGWQYRPEDGQSPPPFDERIETYELRVEGEQVQVRRGANDPGTPTAGVACPANSQDAGSGAGMYVGYRPMPDAHLRFARAIVPICFVLLAVLAGVLGASQRDPGDGVWAYQEVSTLRGELTLMPYPALRIRLGDSDRIRTVLLVAAGKAGARERLEPYDGAFVEIRGTTLSRSGDVRVVELASDDDAIREMSRLAPPDQGVQTAEAGRTFSGEIIDPKCYFGAMKPGEGKAHKACATLCIAGGVPPMFLIRGPGQPDQHYLLTDLEGGPLGPEILPYVADQVSIRGHVVGGGDLAQLRIDPTTIERR